MWKIKSKHKYRAKPTKVDGHRFDSSAEAEYYQNLKLMARAGELEILELQPKIYLTKARILYTPDFKILQNDETVYIDVKGARTTAFAIKERLWKHYGAGKLRLIKKSGKNFILIKEVDYVTS